MTKDTVALDRRHQTRNSMYRYLYETQTPRSKPEIARALGLSMPTVHQNMAELMDLGYICAGGMQSSNGGRRAVGYTIEPAARFSVGVSVTGDNIRFFAANLRLEKLAYKKIPFHLLTSFQGCIQKISDELEDFLDENQLDRAKLLGVGVAFPGVIDEAHRRIVLAPTLQLQNIGLQELDMIPYPTFVDNDGNCGGFAEWFMLHDSRNIAYLSLEDGVGGAVMLNGAPYSGSNGRSGEFGHICVERDGHTCHCGQRGCLEAYCSARRLSEEQGITLEQFFARLAAGDRQCAVLWDDLLDHLAVGVKAIRMTLDCDVVVGGFLAQYLEPYLDVLRHRAAALDTFGGDGTYIRLGKDPCHAVVRGAALHYIQEFLERA